MILRLYWDYTGGCIGDILGLCWGYIRVILGLYMMGITSLVNIQMIPGKRCLCREGRVRDQRLRHKSNRVLLRKPKHLPSCNPSTRNLEP